MKNRLLVLVNVALIPWVALRFPRQVGHYAADCGRILWDGRAR